MSTASGPPTHSRPGHRHRGRRVVRRSRVTTWCGTQLGAGARRYPAAMNERPRGRGRRRARQEDQREHQREHQRVLWGGPVDADRVLAFSDAIFAIAITLLTLKLEVRPGLHGSAFTKDLRDLLPSLGAYALSFSVIANVDYPILVRNLAFLGLIAIMPFPVRLLSDYHDRPLAVAVYALTFIVAMLLQRALWTYVTRPERRHLLRKPVPDEVRQGFTRMIGATLL